MDTDCYQQKLRRWDSIERTAKSQSRSPSPLQPESTTLDDEIDVQNLLKNYRNLESERNRLYEENLLFKADIQELRYKYCLKTRSLRTRISDVSEEAVKFGAENEKLREQLAKNGEELELHMKNCELSSESEAKRELEFKLRDVEQEKLKCCRDLAEFREQNRDLSEKLKELSKNFSISGKKLSDLEPKYLTLKSKVQNAEIILAEQLDEQKHQLRIGFEKERMNMKSSFEAQLASIKKQRTYFNNCNETNKRKHASSEYLFLRHEHMYRQNVRQLHSSVENNTENTLNELSEELLKLVEKKKQKLNDSNMKEAADVVLNNRETSGEIHKKAERIGEKLPDGFVLCPECPRQLAGASTLGRHIRCKHPPNEVIDLSHD